MKNPSGECPGGFHSAWELTITIYEYRYFMNENFVVKYCLK